MIAPKRDPITEIATDLNLLKARLMNIGYYRTGRLLDIALQEIGWEAQGIETPKWQLKRQKETLNVAN